jgi:hypothetical protein
VSLEIRRIAPLRAANVMAVLYFTLFALFSVPMFVFFGSMPAQPNLDPAQQAALRSSMRWMMLAYPFFGAALSWLGTLLAAAIYNLLAPHIGGVSFEANDSRARLPSVPA